MEEEKKAKEEPKKENLESLPSWLWGVLIGICVLILIIGGINYFNNNDSDSETNNEGSSSNQQNETPLRISPDRKWKVIEPPKKVFFTGSFDKPLETEAGKDFSFEGASCKYCVCNSSGIKYCSIGTEDISSQIPNNTHNCELYFMSQEGTSGYIYVVYWVPNL